MADQQMSPRDAALSRAGTPSAEAYALLYIGDEISKLQTPAEPKEPEIEAVRIELEDASDAGATMRAYLEKSDGTEQEVPVGFTLVNKGDSCVIRLTDYR